MATRTLIVNADDFGLSEGVSRGVIQAHAQGIVTSASLMVRAPGARLAAELARTYPRLSVGLHLDLGEWHVHDGQWEPVYLRAALDDEAAIAAEADAQIALFREFLGADPTHIDSHQHVHNKEPVQSVALRRARQLDVPLRHCSASVRYCGDFYGQDSQRGEESPGSLAPARLASLIRSLPAGVTELACHPAAVVDFESPYARERVAELRTLCAPAVICAARDARIVLRSFRGLSFAGT